MINGIGFPREVNTRPLREAEGLKVFIVCFNSEHLTEVDEKRVAGVHQSLSKGLEAVTLNLCAVNCGVRNVVASGAGIGGFEVCNALLQSCRCGKNLKG